MHLSRSTTILVLACSCALFSRANAAIGQADTVDLYLRWWHQFQFAGYYAAIEKGYYKDEGLVVRLHPGSSTDYVMRDVVGKTGAYGVAGIDIMLQRVQGVPVVVLASIFQHSAHAIAVPGSSGIFRPQDLVGKKIEANFDRDPDLKLMFMNLGVPLDSLTVISNRWSLDDLYEKNISAITCYTTTQEYTFQQKGFAYRTIQPANFGVDFYGDCLFTTDDEIFTHPDRVEAFRRASLKGWKYAMDYPDEIIRLILSTYSSPQNPTTYDALAFEANAMRHLILPELVEIGTTSIDRWKRAADACASAGIIRRSASLDGLVFEPEHARNQQWIKWILVGLFTVLLVVVAVGLWIIQLRRLVRERTATLLEKNKALESEIEIRRTVDLALRESEQKVRTLIESMPDAVFFLRLKDSSVEANAFARKILGLQDVTSTIDREQFLEIGRAFLPPGCTTEGWEEILTLSERMESSFLNHSGERLVFDVIRTPVYGYLGEPVGAVIIGRDITKRKLAEESLAEANHALTAIFSASPVAIVAMNTERIVIGWNKASENLFGWTADEAIGKPNPIIPSTDRTDYDSLWQEVLRGKPYDGRILRRTHRSGETLDLFASSAAFKNAAGETIGSVAMFVDLTDTIRTQQQLRESLRDKEVLLKEIHHRVKNNLQVISSLLSLQAERIADRETLDIFRESQNRVRSMAMIHERLYRSPDLAHVDFSEYLRNLTTAVFHSYRSISPQVEIDVEVTPVQLEVDVAIPTGLILNELISNALKYAFPENRAGKVHVTLESNGDTLSLRVKDDGIGLPEGFAPENAKSLGYQLVLLLVDQLHGTLAISSEGGTCVTLTFGLHHTGAVRIPAATSSSTLRAP
jgi:PAS domain S-box-containing protein